MDEFRERLLRPTSRSRIKLVRKHAHSNRDGDALGVEISKLPPVLPIEASARKRRVGEPGDRDVVENIVARVAFRFSRKDA